MGSKGFAGEVQKNYGSTNPSAEPTVGFAGTHFSPTELYNLSENIATNIYTINSSGKTLQQALKSIGTDRDNQGVRDKVHVTQLSCNQIVSQTTKDLQRLSVIVRKGDRQQKLQVEKLRGDFQNAVQCYGKLLQQVVDKMKAHVLARRTSSMTSGYNEDDEVKLVEEQQALATQKSVLRDLQFEQEQLQEQEERIKMIENDILDINATMRMLGTMVHDQGQVIDTIESNLENTHGNVEQGRDELQKAAEYQAKYRRKLCFLIAIAVIIGIILTVIIVTQVRR
ncbi:syntaxin-7 [Anabrus simplex]|uniref:syntaxin-7 n=1 Tax=Anabrus simplex TaxID=316456 RepID=UPI0035A3C0CC